MNPRIVDLHADSDYIDEIARFVSECFHKYSPSWLPDQAACRQEVYESLEPDRRSRVLLDEDDLPIGWIGAIIFDNVWEIHPIAVAPEHQGKGYGKMLVNDVLELARADNVVAVWAGTSDETGSTSFSKIDLYRSPWTSFEEFEAPADHPVHFWSGIGFSLLGAIPAKGADRVGIHFARRL